MPNNEKKTIENHHDTAFFNAPNHSSIHSCLLTAMAEESTSSTLPKAIDLSHHVNTKSKSRHPSPLKDIVQYMAYEGMISLAGGMSIST